MIRVNYKACDSVACDIRIVPRTLKRILKVQLREFIDALDESEVNQARQQLSVVPNPAPRPQVIRICHDFGRKAA